MPLIVGGDEFVEVGVHSTPVVEDRAAEISEAVETAGRVHHGEQRCIECVSQRVRKLAVLTRPAPQCQRGHVATTEVVAGMSLWADGV